MIMLLSQFIIIITHLNLTMYSTNKRNTLLFKIPQKTAERVQKICLLLEKAINEVHCQTKLTPSHSPLKRKSDESSESQTINEVIDNLKKGYLMVKHSQKVSQPHDKFIYLSEDCRYICWKSLQKQDQKRIDITNIDKVIKQGAQFYFKSNRLMDINRGLVIIAKQRKLQLQATSEIEAQYFKYELLRVMKHWKRMSMNYKYNKS